MLFHLKKKPKRIQQALNDYKKLRQYGCFKISCIHCEHLVCDNEYNHTCELERLMKILLPKYSKEVLEINAQT